MMLGSGGLIELRRLESVKGFVPLMRVWTLAVPRTVPSLKKTHPSYEKNVP